MSEAILGIKVGDKATYTKPVTEEDVQAFARVTGDNQPLHMDPDFGKKTRFGSRIAHGMLSAGYISAAIAMSLVGDKGIAIYAGQTLRFMRPVHVGDTITTQIEVIAVDTDRRYLTLSTDCFNQKGEKVLTGDATILLDPAL